MKAKTLLLALIALALMGCEAENNDLELCDNNSVLVLAVDYTTNKFMGGAKLDFKNKSEHFTTYNEFVEPSDFGSIKIIYDEIDETLFSGTIHWMGLGERTFPKSLLPADKFEGVITDNYVSPKNGFENIFNPYEMDLNHEVAWGEVQYLVKVREYLAINPEQKVKLFLYTPSVGLGNPEDWYWVIFLKS